MSSPSTWKNTHPHNTHNVLKVDVIIHWRLIFVIWGWEVYMGYSNVYFSLNAKITTVFRREEKKLVFEMGISSLSCLSCLSQRNGCCACFGTQMWGEGKKPFSSILPCSPGGTLYIRMMKDRLIRERQKFIPMCIMHTHGSPQGWVMEKGG